MHCNYIPRRVFIASHGGIVNAIGPFGYMTQSLVTLLLENRLWIFHLLFDHFYLTAVHRSFELVTSTLDN